MFSDKYFSGIDKSFINNEETDPYYTKHKIICIKGRGVGRPYDFEGTTYNIVEVSLSQDKYRVVLCK